MSNDLIPDTTANGANPADTQPPRLEGPQPQDEQPKVAIRKPNPARILCGLVVAALWVLAIFFLPPWSLVILLALSALICLFELRSMLKRVGYVLPFFWMSVMTALWYTAMYLTMHYANKTPNELGLTVLLPFVLLPIFVMVLFFRVLLSRRVQKPMETAALAVGAFIYVPYLLSFLVPIALCPKIDVSKIDVSAGIFMAFSLVLITKLSDTGAYFVGTMLGSHKMCPRLSPGKTWEGTFGGYVVSLIGALVIIAAAYIFKDAACLDFVRALTNTPAKVMWALLTVIVLVTVGICGDLLESLFKRQCGVKDSSALFPAMGGFFDTFDSIIFVPAAFIFMVALGGLILG